MIIIFLKNGSLLGPLKIIFLFLFFSLEIRKSKKKKKKLSQDPCSFYLELSLGRQLSNNTLVRRGLYIPELFVQFWYVPRLSSWVCTRIVPTILVRKNCRYNSGIK